MKAKQRRRAFWILIVAALLIGAAVVSLLVMARGNEIALTAEAYADVIRFEAYGAASLQIRIYDMAENMLWDSGQVNMDFVDWERTNEWGERLANGYYVYFAQAWSNADELILAKTGKVVLLPGDQVQLQSAPVVAGPTQDAEWREEPVLSPMAQIINENLTVNGTITSQESGTVSNFLKVYAGGTGNRAGFTLTGYNAANSGDFASFTMQTDNAVALFTCYDASAAAWHTAYRFYYLQERFDFEGNAVDNISKLGVGTSEAGVTAKLTVQGTSGDLIAAYNSTNRVFVVENNGTVRADGTVYAADFQTGSADVAERINTSEWVEAGDVVEIDPDHPGFFRKATGSYSRRVAGIISTSPGVILGNSSDPVSGEWEDSRPVLAIAGRVPCKVSDENGPIQIGDLLVASSISGVAMKGNPEEAMGAVVGKAMEPLENGEGTIMVQVMLR